MMSIYTFSGNARILKAKGIGQRPKKPSEFVLEMFCAVGEAELYPWSQLCQQWARSATRILQPLELQNSDDLVSQALDFAMVTSILSFI